MEYEPMLMYKTNKYMLVSVIALLVFLSAPSLSYAAQIYFFPDNQIAVGSESAIFEIRLNTEGDTINALELHGSVVGGSSAAKKIDTSGSVFSIFPEPPVFVSNDFSFFGAVPNGFKGEGIIGRVIVSGRAGESMKLAFASSSRIFSNDARASAASLSLRDGALEIVFRDYSYIALTSASHPDQNRWSFETHFKIHWGALPLVQYSYGISHLATDVPDGIAKVPAGDIQFDALPDGIYYFSICVLGKGECGIVSRYRAMIDTTPPEWVSVQFDKGEPETEGKPFLSFLAKDAGSGIDHYEVALGDADHYTTSTSPLILPDNFYGQVALLAFDGANNNSSKKINVPDDRIVKSLRTPYVMAFLALILLLWISVRLRKNKRVLYNKNSESR